VKVLALIPARMGSSRFPGKPMAELLGRPMIRHVYDNVVRSHVVDLTAVATCDVEIAEYVASIGGRAVMTSDEHERASERCAEALQTVEEEDGVRFDIVVMVQGDEPMAHPGMITEAVEALLDEPSISVVNLLGRISSIDEFHDHNCIKVVCDRSGNALYFSRAPIGGGLQGAAIGKQVCVISFRRDFLLEYASMAVAPLELGESIDMLRILEHGHQVRMIPTQHSSHAVDTPEDLKRVAELMADLGDAY